MKFLPSFVWCLCWVLVFGKAQAQDNSVELSLASRYLKVAQKNIYGSIDSALQYCDRAQQLFTKWGNKEGVFACQKAKLMTFYENHLTDSIRKYSFGPLLHQEMLKNSKEQPLYYELACLWVINEISIGSAKPGKNASLQYYDQLKRSSVKDPETWCNMYLTLSIVYSFADLNVDSSLYYLGLCEEMIKSGSKISELTVAEVYANFVSRHLMKSDLKAMAYGDLALAARRKVYAANHYKIGKLYYTLASAYNLASDIVGTYDCLKKSNAILADPVNRRNWKDELECANNLGFSAMRLGYFDEAISCFERTYALRRVAFGEFHSSTIQSLNSLGNLYRTTGDNVKALSYMEATLRGIQRAEVVDSLQLAKCFNNLGAIHWSLLNYEKATQYFEDALALFERTKGVNEANLAFLYNNLALIYSGHNLLRAKDMFVKSLAIRLRNFDEKSPELISGYRGLALAYSDLNVYDSAIHFMQLATSTALKAFGEHNPEVSECHMVMAEIYQSMGSCYDCVAKSQDALWAAVLREPSQGKWANPSIKERMTNQDFHRILMIKLKCLHLAIQSTEHRAKVEQTAGTPLEDLIIGTIKALDSLGSQVRFELVEEEDKLSWNATVKLANDLSIRILTGKLRNHVIREGSYANGLELAFHFAEKSKASLLAQAMESSKAKNVSGIPDSLLEQELALRANRLELEKKLAEELKLSGEEANPSLIQKLQEQLFANERALDQLINYCERTYPQFYQSRFSDKTASIAAIQASLGKDELFLSYHFAADSIYLFEIGKKSFALEVRALDPDLQHWLAGFRNALYLKLPKLYSYTGYRLYRELFPKSYAVDYQRIIVSTASELGGIPLEALLYENVDYEKFGPEMPFLHKQLEVDYVYSANLFLENRQAFRKNKIKESSLLVYAPVFESDEQPQQGIRTLNFKGSIPTLNGSRQEANACVELFAEYKQTSFARIGLDATEKNLWNEDFSQYSIVHFASHGFVDVANPAFSGVLLAQVPDSLRDNVLYAGEIYSLKMPVDLVILSACETGLGRSRSGEGIVGLGRALLFAGAKNLVLSLWKVDDAATGQLMGLFYKELLSQKRNKSYSSALRQAKRRMMETAEFSAPYYWASFTFIGAK